MPAGCGVVKYEGKRGVVWYLIWVDATGKQIKKKLGRADDGWTRELAQQELDERLGRIEIDRVAQRVGLLTNELRGRTHTLGLVGRGQLPRAYDHLRKLALEVDQISVSIEARPHLRAAMAGLYAAEDALILAAKEERGR